MISVGAGSSTSGGLEVAPARPFRKGLKTQANEMAVVNNLLELEIS